jgi:hypothetical protein
MTKQTLAFLLFIAAACTSLAQAPPKKHPDTKGAGWVNLFKSDLSDATYDAEAPIYFRNIRVKELK